jgi:ammonia channel protein AmtB
LCAGLFNRQDYINLAYGPNIIILDVGKQFGYQLLEIIWIILWTGSTSLLTLLALKYTIGIRVDKNDEVVGLDFKYHKGLAYHSHFLSSAALNPLNSTN